MVLLLSIVYPFNLLSASPLQTRNKICTIVITSIHVYFQSTGRESWERQVSMSSDTPLVVNLEVTVPRIIPAKGPPRPGRSGTATGEQRSERDRSPTEPTTHAIPIIGGKNRVVMYLNSEGTPESYSIDGVKS